MTPNQNWPDRRASLRQTMAAWGLLAAILAVFLAF